MSASTYEVLVSEFKVTVGLCMPPLQRSGIASVPIGKQPLLLAMPARSPLARHKVVPMAKLQGMKLVGLPSARVENGADTSPIGSLLRRHHITMQIIQRVETVHSALALVLAGEGFSIVPACAALGSPPGVSFRPLEDDGGGMEVAVCWRRDLDNPLIKPFIAAVQAAMA
jgi:DNA-binding transcriptional LysR family regulator